MQLFVLSALVLLGQLVCAISQPAQEPLLRHSDAFGRNISVALFSELEEFARIVDISYCVGLASSGISKPFTCLSRCADFPSFELVSAWNTGPLLSDSCGYVALDHGKQRIIVAFRGTYSIANTVVDLSTVPQKYVPYPGEDDDDDDASESILGGLPKRAGPECTNCTVHWGFQTSWKNTRKEILRYVQENVFLHPDYQLSLVGHSLGGAVAALAALDFKARGWNPQVTTFGEPRVGNMALVQYLDNRFDLTRQLPSDDTQLLYRRVTHVDDPVPLLPLTEWGYAMHAGEIYISKHSLSPDLVDVNHCEGDNDPNCIAGQDSTPEDPGSASSVKSGQKRDLLASVEDEIYDVVHEPWGVPSRYKLWELFFAHRDYFWRIGLCVPGGDPLGGGSKYDPPKGDL